LRINREVIYLLLGVNGVLKVGDFGEAKWLPLLLDDGSDKQESMLTVTILLP
jgi:hypothetical protein